MKGYLIFDIDFHKLVCLEDQEKWGDETGSETQEAVLGDNKGFEVNIY